MNVCVYCGSRSGNDPRFEQAAIDVGASIARRGWGLIYGGGNIGLMGSVARTALAHGAHVTGIIPTFLATKEIALQDCSELIEVESMHIRKQLMIDRSDILVALPGGFGTLDELFEALTWRQIRLHARPIGLLNIAGYYNPLLTMIERMRSDGFVQDRHASMLWVSDSVEALFDELAGTTTSQFGDHLDLA
ncbi:MAG: TIGR00730 family Rossman fold protein [Candidatus Kapabacteria bacterium]|nr:TIGR00730 family Rossman fold protein [Candidatus Kapabacteria bacterium]